MEEGPRPDYVRYARPHLEVDPHKLEILRDAYFGSQWLVVSTLAGYLVAFPATVGMAALFGTAGPSVAYWSMIVVFAALLIVNLAISHKYAAAVAEARAKGAFYRVGLAAMAALLSLVCVGLLACAIIQQEAAYEFKLCGLRPGFLGYRKEDIQAAIEKARQAQEVPQFDLPPTPLSH